MSPSTSARFGDANRAVVGNAARGCHYVIATIQKRLDNGRSDALRGAGYNDCLLTWHAFLLLFFASAPHFLKILEPGPSSSRK